MRRAFLCLASFVLACVLGLLVPALGRHGGPAWLSHAGAGWIVVRSLVLAPIAVGLSLWLSSLGRRSAPRQGSTS